MNRCKVQEIAELITKGTTPTTLGFSYIDEGINFVKIESIDANGNFDKTKFAHISEECHVSLKRSKLQKNDILFSIAGAIGRTAIVSEDILPANTNQALAIIRLKKNNNDLNFIRYQLSSASVIKQTEKQKQGVAQLNLSLKDIGNLEINVPSLPEQKKIASHLDTIQSAIDNKKQQLQQLDELVKSKFVEMFGDVKEQVSIKEICDVSGGYSFKSGDISENSGIRILQIGNVALNDVSWEVTNYLPKDFEKKYESFLLKKDDIVMALTRPIIQSLGNVKTSLVKSTDLPCLLNQRVGKIRAKFGTNIRFVYYCFMQHSFTDYVQSCCKGSSQPNMSTKDIENYEIPKVDINLQNTFAEYVQKIDSAKSIIKTQLNDLNELLESKMDFYFGA